MSLPSVTPEDYVARTKEVSLEVGRLSHAVHDSSASIRGAAVSNVSLLQINYVQPERLKSMWRLPPNPPDIEKFFPDLSEYIDEFLADFDHISTEGIPLWKADFRSCAVFQALRGVIDECLIHNPDRDLNEPPPYTLFYGTPLMDESHMYWSNRRVIFTPNMPNLTVISMHPQQGPPNQLTVTEFYSLLYFGLRFSTRIKNMTHVPIRLISICDTQARIVSANFSREYLRFAYRPETSRLNPRVSCEVSVEDYHNVREKEHFLNLMRRISEVGVKAGPTPYG